nr:L,D-transpeptidase [Candidatus Methylobacter favarea]
MWRIFLLLGCGFFSLVASADNKVWLLVDTTALTIEVKKGNQTIETLNDIAIGRGGAGLKTHRGDNITPFGNYKIGWVGQQSSYRKFFGLTYPSVEDAQNALIQGVIDRATYNNIVTAHRYHQVPPQNTPLGGRIGIHGLGRADAEIHKTMNWTHGCIALTNRQIDHLSQWLDRGTVVKIK